MHTYDQEEATVAYPGGGATYGQTSLVTGDAVVLDLRPAGFATRLAALFVDISVQLTAIIGLNILAVRIGAGVDSAATAAVQLALTVLVLVGYPTAFETFTRGRSLGKMAVGLRVVGVDGSPVRFRQALARALTAAVEIWTFFGIVALVVSLTNRDGRRVGDFLAGTMVVSERTRRKRDETIEMPPRMAAWAASAQLSGLSSETAAMARQYVLRYDELTEQARYEMGVRIADMVAASVGPPPPPGTSPPEYLAAVLAERRRREEERMAARQAGPPTV
ncbi:RDD family protein [Nocardiopsis gilva YIM 90087]|uniref:RDD family protein n=1 Tax=Nocardiopsis gilva YIM 90087 TaxID=1235441 RepID=A0A223SBD2_9ACTN|nr:RDD family protein [Nocardiopsis gilva]ASU85481.1 RDD family protein [Nocardiopsis gilva YIM 90087]